MTHDIPQGYTLCDQSEATHVIPSLRQTFQHVASHSINSGGVYRINQGSTQGGFDLLLDNGESRFCLWSNSAHGYEYTPIKESPVECVTIYGPKWVKRLRDTYRHFDDNGNGDTAYGIFHAGRMAIQDQFGVSFSAAVAVFHERDAAWIDSGEFYVITTETTTRKL